MPNRRLLILASENAGGDKLYDPWLYMLALDFGAAEIV
jgi:hypothetical protein